MKILEINIKENNPPPDVAMSELWLEIERSAFSETEVIKVIHGYGSHGKGGEIKKAVTQLLTDLLKQKKIKGFVPGEHFGAEAIEKFEISKKYPQLLIQSDITVRNSGLTLIFLNK